MNLNYQRFPQAHIEFAKEVANAAVKYGIDKFDLTYAPKFSERLDFGLDWSNVVIGFLASDSRGRPAVNFSVSLETRLKKAIITTQGSSD